MFRASFIASNLQAVLEVAKNRDFFTEINEGLGKVATNNSQQQTQVSVDRLFSNLHSVEFLENTSVLLRGFFQFTGDVWCSL